MLARMRSERRRARRRRGAAWIGGAALASSLISAPVHAEDERIFGGGAFFGYRFGERSGFEWGFEAFATHRFTGGGCSSEERIGFGPLAQLGFLGIEEPRLTLGMQGGGELERAALALTAQVGLSYRFGTEPGFGVHTGVLPEFSLVNVGVSYEWLLAQGWVGGGARYFPTYGEPSLCAIGRPLRTEHGVLQLSVCAPPCDEPARRERGAVEPVGLAFARDAQLEAESIPAFLQLARELHVAGAPTSLVRRALSAAADEQRHARLCSALAQRHLGRPIAVVIPELSARPALPRRAALLRLATESWLDGCLGEGRAAAQAAAAAARTHDVGARDALTGIADDEQRHAELAWSILHWTLELAGDDARHAVHCAFRSAETAVPADHAPHGLDAHGRLDAATLTAIATQHTDRARARLHARM